MHKKQVNSDDEILQKHDSNNKEVKKDIHRSFEFGWPTIIIKQYLYSNIIMWPYTKNMDDLSAKKKTTYWSFPSMIFYIITKSDYFRKMFGANDGIKFILNKLWFLCKE